VGPPEGGRYGSVETAREPSQTSKPHYISPRKNKTSSKTRMAMIVSSRK
jgi:hypothetical protein